MSSSILFVFEGEKTEKQITDNLTQFFVNENTNVKCAFCADDSFTLPLSIISQLEIFRNQLTKYIQNDSTVSVLSAFPIFIFDYYGYSKIIQILGDK